MTGEKSANLSVPRLSRGVRTPERVYRGVLWLVSIIFAAFIIGLGNLLIGDLALLDQTVVEQPLGATPEQQRIDAAIKSANDQRGPINDQLQITNLQLEQARQASATGTETFSAWIAARTATTNPQQDPEVLARTRALEQLKANERVLQHTACEFEAQLLTIDQQISQLNEQRYQADMAAIPAQEKAQFWRDLRVFGLRLLLALPMLAIASWMVVKKRQSEYWPLMRGFVLAAVFVFFVELVPYLPSYGGYIRYAVGIVLTFAAGHFLIKHMRSYLAKRRETEAQAEQERRRQVSHDEAFRKMAARTCPGCDRPISTTGEAEANFCVHCGMTLFDRCTRCDTRKMAFFRYCMTCGNSADDSKPVEPATPQASSEPGQTDPQTPPPLPG